MDISDLNFPDCTSDMSTHLELYNLGSRIPGIEVTQAVSRRKVDSLRRRDGQTNVRAAGRRRMYGGFARSRLVSKNSIYVSNFGFAVKVDKPRGDRRWHEIVRTQHSARA